MDGQSKSTSLHWTHKRNIDFYTYKSPLGLSIGAGHPGSQISLVFLHPGHETIEGPGRPGQQAGTGEHLQLYVMYSCIAGLYRRRSSQTPTYSQSLASPPPPNNLLPESWEFLWTADARVCPTRPAEGPLPLPASLSPTPNLSTSSFLFPSAPVPLEIDYNCFFSIFYAVCFPSSSVCHSVSVNTVSAIATLPGSRQTTTFLLHPDSSLVLGYPSLLFLSSSSLPHMREPQPCPYHHHHSGAPQLASVS